MKFEEIKNLNTPNKTYSKKEIKKSNKISDIKLINRHGSLAIILMNPHTNGSLRDLSVIVNDGEINCSWVVRITFNNNEWLLSLAPYSNIEKSNIEINVFQTILDKFENYNITGNLHTAFLKSKNKKEIEEVTNYIISIFSKIQIKGIENFEINKKYQTENTTSEYKIIHEFVELQGDKSKLKNIELIKIILENSPTDKEKEDILYLLTRINENKSIDVDLLNSLSTKYCTSKQRLQIAIKFMA